MDKQNSKYVRCFVALELDRVTREYIEELNSMIKKKNLFAGKFTDIENLHLTLKFLGEIEESRVEQIKKILSKINMKSFEVSLGEIGVFNNAFNSILWLKLNGKEIWELQKIIDEKLLGLFEPEERFMSHITLARMKKIHDKQEFLDYIKNIKLKKVKFKVNDFVFKKSELKPEGPIYTDLEKYSLDA